MRPKSEPPARFDHLRGARHANHPDIQRTLEQSNCEYRVSPCQTAREPEPDPSTSDFVMLIPVTSEASDVTGDDVVRAWDEEEEDEGPVLASTARSRSPGSDMDDRSER